MKFLGKSVLNLKQLCIELSETLLALLEGFFVELSYDFVGNALCMKKSMLIVYLAVCSVLDAESFLATTWQVKEPPQTSTNNLKLCNLTSESNRTPRAVLNKDVSIPLVVQNQVKGNITFKQGRELLIFKETFTTVSVSIGTFVCEISKADVSFN